MKKNTYKPPCEQANKSDKEYISEMIQQIENEVKEKCAKERLRNNTVNLTKDWHRRVNKIVNLRKIKNHEQPKEVMIMESADEPIEIEEKRYRVSWKFSEHRY